MRGLFMTDTKEHEELFNIIYPTLLTLIIFDIMFTWYGLSNGFTEQNPVLGFLVFKLDLLIAMSIMVILSATFAYLLYVFSQIVEKNTVNNYLLVLIGWKLAVVMTWIGVLIK